MRAFMAVCGFIGVLCGATRADGLFSLTNLGPANPSASYLDGTSQLDASGNYLGALGVADRAAFQSGSFDVFAHPSTASTLPNYYSTGAIQNGQVQADVGVLALNWLAPPQYMVLANPEMVTGNNLGSNAGFATGSSAFGAPYIGKQLVDFTPDPHSVKILNLSQPGATQTAQGPGYLSLILTPFSTPPLMSPETSMGYGHAVGLNDRNVLLYTAVTQASGTTSQQSYLLSPNSQGPFGTSIDHPNGDPLGTLGGASTVAGALNNANQVVGWSQTSTGARHAFLYSNGAMQDLNLLIPTSANVHLIDAVGIDGSGRIVAYGTDSSGQTDEFLLTPLEAPVPEPSTLAIFGLVIAALAAQGIRSRRLTGI